MSSWCIVTIVIVALDCALAGYGSDHMPRSPWHLLPGSGFYAAWLRLNDRTPIARSFWDEFFDIDPGHITVLTDKRNGNQYALMNLDDFDHLIGTGNKFVRKRLSVSASTESK